jgi:hypothetical protein
MVKLYIDSQRCDTGEDFVLPKNIFNLNNQTLTEVERQQEGTSITLRIPASHRNDAIMGFAADPHAEVRFNASFHHGEIECDGVVVFGGVVHLEAIEAEPIASGSRGHSVSYRIRITDGADEWAKQMATTPLQETALVYSATLNGATIAESWEEDSVVRFLPVYRDEYLRSEEQDTLYPPQRVLTVGDYHPFIAVKSLVEAMFAERGYTIKGNFWQSELMKSLMISGCTAADNSLSAARLMSVAGFCAGRENTATAEADYSGRVYLSSVVLANSLGNFVESADKSLNEEFFNNGNSLSISEEGVIYRPRVAASVAFDIYLKYTTDYRILSRERLQGFDSIYVDAGCDMQFGILNPYTDRRGEIAARTNYLCTIFDFAEGEHYRIEWKNTAGVISYTDLTARATTVTSVAGSSADCRLLKEQADGSFAEAEGDWAMYDGYVEECGSREVEVTLRTAPEVLSPQHAKEFIRMYMYGAEPHQRITLSAECRLRPVFTSAAGLGSHLTAKDILQHNATQMNLLTALQQMFNLHIYSDKQRREVWIEPHDDFYNDDCHDWSHRVVLSDNLSAEEIAAEVGARRTLAYRSDGGGAVSRFNLKQQTTLGEWSAKTDSYIARERNHRQTNTLFCPTLSATKVFADAPSAALLSVGNRDADEVGDSAVRIVRWEGVLQLPATERWGFPSNGNRYPFAAFHYPAGKSGEEGAALVGDIPATGPEESFTLCFEDRDAAVGLHAHYDRKWRVEALRRKITLSIRISPEEMLALRDMRSDGPNICSLFRLEADRQTNLFRLHSIVGYDIEQGVARMVFVHKD